MTTDDVFRAARLYLDDNPEHRSSARLCMSDAMTLLDRGETRDAARRALRSLAYSVGVLHPVYRRCATFVVGLDLPPNT